MNNNSSPGFSTVFFLVAFFVATGLLIYHAYELTQANGDLKTINTALQADIASANAKVAAFQKENADLKAEIAALKTGAEDLTTENTQLKTAASGLLTENKSLKDELAAVVSENDILQAEVESSRSELQRLRSENDLLHQENQRLIEMRASLTESSVAEPQMLISTLLPTEKDFWINLISVALILAILIETYTLVRLLRQKHNHLNTVAARLNSNRSQYPRNRGTHIIDARFVQPENRLGR